MPTRRTSPRAMPRTGPWSSVAILRSESSARTAIDDRELIAMSIESSQNRTTDCRARAHQPPSARTADGIATGVFEEWAANAA